MFISQYSYVTECPQNNVWSHDFQMGLLVDINILCGPLKNRFSRVNSVYVIQLYAGHG